MFNNKLTPLALLIPALLSGCGSDSDSNQVDEPTPPPPASNVAPVAAADSAMVTNGAVIEVDVLANDSDQDGDTLTISEIGTEPSMGSVTISSDSITYTPSAMDTAGTDSFSYIISDGESTAEAEVSVTLSQTLSLSGQVTDSPIANATVVVKSTLQRQMPTAFMSLRWRPPICNKC